MASFAGQTASRLGRLTLVDKQQRVLPWWRVDVNGSYVVFVPLGSKPIEFEKGKNAIAVPSLDKMPLVINILITAVRNGELDDQLAHEGLGSHAHARERLHIAADDEFERRAAAGQDIPELVGGKLERAQEQAGERNQHDHRQPGQRQSHRKTEARQRAASCDARAQL